MSAPPPEEWAGPAKAPPSRARPRRTGQAKQAACFSWYRSAPAGLQLGRGDHGVYAASVGGRIAGGNAQRAGATRVPGIQSPVDGGECDFVPGDLVPREQGNLQALRTGGE